jgi:RNA recognition motif-containing protein
VNRLYVGNLPYSCDDRRLAELFSAAGNVTSARISTRHLLNGHTEGGRELVVDLARETRVARA